MPPFLVVRTASTKTHATDVENVGIDENVDDA
jgi:hypothetical protein